jgi:hypothetical protein
MVEGMWRETGRAGERRLYSWDVIVIVFGLTITDLFMVSPEEVTGFGVLPRPFFPPFVDLIILLL